MSKDDKFTHAIDQVISKYKSDDNVGTIHEYSVDLPANQIYLLGEESYIENVDDTSEPGVEYSMANRFIKNLNILMRKSGDPILIHMKTCGGDWNEGMAIYDTIKACPNKVVILSYTHARSMSSLIFQAADKRVMMPHSSFLFHEGSTGFGGTVKQVRSDYEWGLVIDEQMMLIYIDSMKRKGKYRKWSRERIREWLVNEMKEREDVYLTAQQAVDLGFADEVFGADGSWDWESLVDKDVE